MNASTSQGEEPCGTPAERGAVIDLTVSDPGWRAACPDIERLVDGAARAALAIGAAAATAELGVMLCDDRMIQSLNREYRGLDKPTNVLAFALDADAPPAPETGAPLMLGDVVVARETVIAEAAAAGRPVAHHLSHMVVHGVLHLLGEDHQEDAEARRMEALETRALATLGVPDPHLGTEAA